MRIGWIGTGVMGAPMVGHLLAAGHEVTVNTRTRSRAEALLDAGATWTDVPSAVAEGADVVVTMLGYPHDVRETILGEDGVLAAMAKGTTLVDHTTSEPALAEEIARANGISVTDAQRDAVIKGSNLAALLDVPDAKPIAYDLADQQLVSKAVGADAYLKAVQATDVELNPRFGVLDPAQKIIADGQSSSLSLPASGS